MNSVKKLAVVLLAFGLMCAAPVMSKAGEMKGMMNDGMKVVVGNDGFCPVCSIHGKMSKGTEDFVTVYEGKKYMFADMSHQKAFLDNPQEFIKGLGMKNMEMRK